MDEEMGRMQPDDAQRNAFRRALRDKAMKKAAYPAANPRSRAGIAPNKAAGSKGGIRRQGSKRG